MKLSTQLDCYWVGSLDFNFLGNQGGFHQTHTKVKHFLQRGQQQPSQLRTFVHVPGLAANFPRFRRLPISKEHRRGVARKHMSDRHNGTWVCFKTGNQKEVHNNSEVVCGEEQKRGCSFPAVLGPVFSVIR